VLNTRSRQARSWFGTKRPQVQILSPRPRLCRQRPLPELVRASLAASTAAKCRKYRNKSEHLSFSSNGLPQPAQRFAGTKRPQA